MMPSVAELTYFYEVSQTLNVSHAANNLRISQPTLSRAIQHLESTVGTSLLIRHKTGVVLTPAGKQLLSSVKPLLQNWQNTKLQTLAAHQEVVGNVSIGCHSTVGLFIHRIIITLLENYSKLQLRLEHSASDIVTQRVIDLNLDIGIVTNPVQYPDLIIRKLNTIDTTLWVGQGKRKLQNMQSSEAVLICHPDMPHTKMILQKCKTAGIQFARTMKVNSLEVVANLTANGCGIGLLPSCFIESLYPNKLKCIPDVPVVRDQLCLIYRRESLNVRAIKTVIGTIAQWGEK